MVASTRSDRFGHLAFGGFCLLVCGLRAGILLDPPVPSGLDPGNWLAYGHSVVGHGIRSGTVYPPVVPLLVLGSVSVLGLAYGVAVVALVSSLAPGLAVYLVLRASGLGWRSAIPAAFLVAAGSTGEPTAWGGYPQLLAIGLSVVLLLVLDRYLRTGARADAVRLGAVAFALLATSHFIAAAAAVAAAVLVVLHLVVLRAGDRERPLARVLAGAAIALAPCVLLAPLYLHLSQTVFSTLVSRPSPNPLQPTGLAASARLLFQDYPGFWRNGLIIAGLTPLVTMHRRRASLWMITSALMAAAVILVVAGGDFRFVYLLPPVVVLAIGCLLHDLRQGSGPALRRLEQAIVAVLAVALAVQTASGLDTFRRQRDYYRLLTPGLVDGITWVRNNIPPRALVAVTPLRGLPLGWWVEGYGERPTLTASDLNWLNFPDERSRARRANSIFSGEFPSASSIHRARRERVRFLLVAKSWDGYDRQRMALFIDQTRTNVAYENVDTVILDVSGQSRRVTSAPRVSAGAILSGAASNSAPRHVGRRLPS